MGGHLPKPHTNKYSENVENERLRVGVSTMQGWRTSMEDAHIIEPDFDTKVSLFAIFDGHGGDEVAKFCAKNFGDCLKESKKYQMGRYEDALIDTFLLMDKLIGHPECQAELRQLKTDRNDNMQAGCTANVVLITEDNIYCANAGDSKAILWSNGKKVFY